MASNHFILDEWKQILSAQGLSSQEQDRVIAHLDRALMANMLARLVKELPPQQLAEFTASDTQSPQQMISYLISSCTPLRLKELLQLSSEEVLTQFDQQMKP